MSGRTQVLRPYIGNMLNDSLNIVTHRAGECVKVSLVVHYVQSHLAPGAMELECITCFFALACWTCVRSAR